MKKYKPKFKYNEIVLYNGREYLVKGQIFNLNYVYMYDLLKYSIDLDEGENDIPLLEGGDFIFNINENKISKNKLEKRMDNIKKILETV